MLQLRFGLEDGHARTLEEVGKEFNVTRERIRQIEVKALRKLRHPSRSRKLRDFLEEAGPAGPHQSAGLVLDRGALRSDPPGPSPAERGTVG